jgi:predicted dehydrogenase
MSKKVKLGFVGCGGIARAHVESLIKNPCVEFAAFCDAVVGRAEGFARNYGMGRAQVFTDAATMFEKVELDAVYFCLPPFAHGAEMYAVEYNVPFFVEKPIDLYLDRAERIAEAVERKKLITSVGYMNRYRKGVNIVRELLKEDPPILVLGGWIGETPRAETWFIVKEKSGGQFHEQVTHTVDLVRFLCGEIVEVYALPARGFNKDVPPSYNVEDASVVNLRFANGAVGSLWASISANAGGGGVSLSIYANRTTALFTGWEHSLRLLRKDAKPEEVPGESDIFSIEDFAFIEAVQQNDPSKIKCPYSEGLKTLRVTLAANKSMETGTPVRLD